MENRLSLATISSLFAIIPSLTLSKQASRTSLVLGDLKRLVRMAFLAKGLSRLWYVDLTPIRKAKMSQLHFEIDRTTRSGI